MTSSGSPAEHPVLLPGDRTRVSPSTTPVHEGLPFILLDVLFEVSVVETNVSADLHEADPPGRDETPDHSRCHTKPLGGLFHRQ